MFGAVCMYILDAPVQCEELVLSYIMGIIHMYSKHNELARKWCKYFCTV